MNEIIETDDSKITVSEKNFIRDLYEFSDGQLQDYYASSELCSKNEMQSVISEMQRRNLPFTSSNKSKGVKLGADSSYRHFVHFFSIPYCPTPKEGLYKMTWKKRYDFSDVMSHRVEVTESKREQNSGCFVPLFLSVLFTLLLDFLVLNPKENKLTSGTYILHFIVIGFIILVFGAIPYTKFKTHRTLVTQMEKDRMAKGQDIKKMEIRLVKDYEWDFFCKSNKEIDLV